MTNNIFGFIGGDSRKWKIVSMTNVHGESLGPFSFIDTLQIPAKIYQLNLLHG